MLLSYEKGQQDSKMGWGNRERIPLSEWEGSTDLWWRSKVTEN